MGHEQMIKRIQKDENHWKKFLKWELEFCKEPGIIDGGTHMIVVIQKNN